MTHNDKPNKGYLTNLGLFCHKTYGREVEILHCSEISSIGNGLFLAHFYLKNNKNRKNEQFLNHFSIYGPQTMLIKFHFLIFGHAVLVHTFLTRP